LRQKRNKQHEKNNNHINNRIHAIHDYVWWFFVSTLRPVALIGISNAHGTRQARSDEGTQFVDFGIASQQGLR
jgi:hypothetical protein